MASVFTAVGTNLISFFVFPPSRQAPYLMQITCKELAKNFGKLEIPNAHLETLCDILQFSKRRQLQQTASYKIRWRRCARRMAHRDILGRSCECWRCLLRQRGEVPLDAWQTARLAFNQKTLVGAFFFIAISFQHPPILRSTPLRRSVKGAPASLTLLRSETTSVATTAAAAAVCYFVVFDIMFCLSSLLRFRLV